MAKYSYEFKKQVIEAYLSGEGGYKYLAKRYGVPAWSNIKKWVRNYETHGDKGLMRSRKQDKYSFEKKLSVVELYLEVNSHIRSWLFVKEYIIPLKSVSG